MLWLKFRSDGYSSCVWGLCSSSEDAKVRLGWLVVVHDVPGPLAVFRERGFGKSQWRAVHVRRDQTFVFLRVGQYWRCFSFNVQRYLSPEVSVHFIFFRLSISGELRTIDSCPEACTCTFVTNLAGHTHSAIVKRKKKEINMNKYCHGRTALFSLGVVEHASGQQLKSRHCSSQQSRKNPKECVISKEFAMSRPPDNGTNNAQPTCWWTG